jgi:hypothetical protein
MVVKLGAMTPGSLPPRPVGPVAHGLVMLREFSARDAPKAQELSTDPYVPFCRDLAGGFASAALIALTSFGWTIPALHRIELYIEPWNAGSIGTAERAGYQREGLLRSHQEIGGRRRDMLLCASVRDTVS